MPTARRRHVITETDEVARALDVAAKRWPQDGDRRGKLLMRLVEEGRKAVTEERGNAAAKRRAALERTSGVLRGSYENDYLQGLREDWPA